MRNGMDDDDDRRARPFLGAITESIYHSVYAYGCDMNHVD